MQWYMCFWNKRHVLNEKMRQFSKHKRYFLQSKHVEYNMKIQTKQLYLCSNSLRKVKIMMIFFRKMLKEFWRFLVFRSKSKKPLYLPKNKVIFLHKRVWNFFHTFFIHISVTKQKRSSALHSIEFLHWCSSLWPYFKSVVRVLWTPHTPEWVPLLVNRFLN